MKREGLSKNLVNSNWWKVHKPFFLFYAAQLAFGFVYINHG